MLLIPLEHKFGDMGSFGAAVVVAWGNLFQLGIVPSRAGDHHGYSWAAGWLKARATGMLTWGGPKMVPFQLVMKRSSGSLRP